MNYKTYTGMVLRRIPLKEADELITFWSWEEGKVRVIARSVRKQDSKLKGILGAGSWLEIYVVPSGRFTILTSVRVISGSYGPASSLDNASLFFSVVEAVDKATADEEPNEEVTLLLQRVLRFLSDERSSQEIEDFNALFLNELVDALGYHLQLQACISCNKAVAGEDKIFLDKSSFSTLCQNCAKHYSGSEELDLRVLEYLNTLQTKKEPKLLGEFSKETKRQARKTLISCYHFITGREIKSEKFFVQNFS